MFVYWVIYGFLLANNGWLVENTAQVSSITFLWGHSWVVLTSVQENHGMSQRGTWCSPPFSGFMGFLHVSSIQIHPVMQCFSKHSQADRDFSNERSDAEDLLESPTVSWRSRGVFSSLKRECLSTYVTVFWKEYILLSKVQRFRQTTYATNISYIISARHHDRTINFKGRLKRWTPHQLLQGLRWSCQRTPVDKVSGGRLAKEGSSKCLLVLAVLVFCVFFLQEVLLIVSTWDLVFSYCVMLVDVALEAAAIIWAVTEESCFQAAWVPISGLSPFGTL